MKITEGEFKEGWVLMIASGLGSEKWRKIMRKEGKTREREGKPCLLIDFKIVLIHFNAPPGPRLVENLSQHANSAKCFELESNYHTVSDCLRIV